MHSPPKSFSLAGNVGNCTFIVTISDFLPNATLDNPRTGHFPTQVTIFIRPQYDVPPLGFVEVTLPGFTGFARTVCNAGWETKLPGCVENMGIGTGCFICTAVLCFISHFDGCRASQAYPRVKFDLVECKTEPSGAVCKCVHCAQRTDSQHCKHADCLHTPLELPNTPEPLLHCRYGHHTHTTLAGGSVMCRPRLTPTPPHPTLPTHGNSPSCPTLHPTAPPISRSCKRPGTGHQLYILGDQPAFMELPPTLTPDPPQTCKGCPAPPPLCPSFSFHDLQVPKKCSVFKRNLLLWRIH